MEVGVLGSTVAVGADGGEATLARKPRAVLAALALAPGRDVSADRVVDLVWGAGPPPGAHGTLHAYLSTLRRAFEPALAPRTASSAIATTDDGYRLLLPAERVDAVRFAAEARRLHAAAAPLWSQLGPGRSPAWPSAAEAATLADALERALATWRGPAFADLGDHPDVLAERASLDELRAGAQEDLQVVLLALGEHAAVVAASEQAVARDPLRERSRCLRALALLRSGRQVEALEDLREHRRLLSDELGLDPGPDVRALEGALLRQDPALWSTLVEPPTDTPGAGSRPGSGSAPTVAPEEAPAAAPRSAPAWGTVGREREAATLEALVAEAVAGRPGVVVVVGEPGIGKTRLVHDTVAVAGRLGATSAVARCSHDDGAPPLWPWYALLEALGVEPPAAAPTPDEDVDAPQRAFAVQEALVRAVRQRARRDPLLLVVEDLHWADTRTLRALAHLVTALGPGDRVALVLTRRRHPEPAGALLDLGAVLARHGAGVLEPAGLDPAQAAALVDDLVGDAGRAPVATWCADTGGNPFFLVELARTGLAGGGWHDTVPSSVTTVVAERLAGLPEDTREALLVCAALGREPSTPLLAHVGGWSPEVVLERLLPAQRIGIVRVREDGRVAFEHALSRDAVLAAAPAGRVSRVHARIAQALGTAPALALGPTERTFELARHWRAAGPVHAPAAWRAAVAAAGLARRDWANVEATTLLADALHSHALDPAATAEERYDLLLAYAEVGARAARWRRVVEAVVEAVGLARDADDPQRVATAVAALSRYNIWLPQAYGEVFEDLVDDLRTVLRSAGAQDHPTRCRLMLALALQLYYAPGYEPEVEALVDEGLALARRVGDPELRCWAARTAWMALWRAHHLGRRLELAREEIETARACGDEAAEAVGNAALAGACVEAGYRDGWLEHSAAAEALARRRRLPYVEFALGLVRLGLEHMAGRREEADATEARLRELRGEVTTPADDSMDFALAFAAGAWRPEVTPAVAEAFRQVMAATPDPFLEVGMLFQLARAGRIEEVREAITRSPLPPVPDLWHATMEAAERADISALTGDPAPARQALATLRSTSGRMVVAGVSIGFGPVDGYLAVALAVLGEPDEAARAAARAEALGREWELTTYLGWLAERRAAVGF
ncbi:BTAD domain-containing putative transcriptional regulator [Phycicoccus avicenniae]|uniref:BTAD domain-containing putative transcriptional regulator n=1 Tax=Phycicoccus avicenniae TaxID=2828860 RepID=UPI003D267E25